MKNQTQSHFPLLFGILVIVIALAGAGFLYIQNSGQNEAPNGNNGDTAIDVSGWPEYVNESYDFAIKYPPGWEVASFPDDPITPKFNVYKPETTDKEPPFDHFAEVTQIGVFPQGIPTEGEFGITEDVDLPIKEQTTEDSRQFVFQDGTLWAASLKFTQSPSSWNESGFVWMKLKRDDLETHCFRDGESVNSEECDPLFGDTIEHTGTVNEKDQEILRAMIGTFRLLEHGSGDVSDNINLFSPKPGAEVESPLTIAGEARGFWYFEATFPIVITDWNGRIVGEGYAEAQDEWMTEDFVPFLAEVEFTPPEDASNKNGTLIIQRANPSGLPENDAAVEIPITFK